MDFRSLSRRELQALCKRNKIPANLTNVAMADALTALPSVEGIEDFNNGVFSGVPESPMRDDVISSEIPRTAMRTSTRRMAVKDEAVTTRTRRTTAVRSTEESENRDLNVNLTTPSLPTGRRRTAADSSACKKVDFQMTVDVVEKEDKDLDQEMSVIEKTPAVPKSQKRVVGASTRKRTETQNNGDTAQRVYSTRRSVRLLEKTLENLSLGGDGKMDPIPVPMSFDEMPGLVKEDADLESESKKPDESESKLEEDLKLEMDDQEKNGIESEIKLSEVEPEMGLGSLNSNADNTVTAKTCGDSETEDDNSDMKCSSEDEETNEASKDEDAVEISAEKPSDSDKFSLPTENVEESGESEPTMEEEALEVDNEDDKNEIEMEMEKVSVQVEEDYTIESMEVPEKASEELVDDVKIQVAMEEETPKDIPCEKEEALVEVSVPKTEENVQSVPSFANQFPRPTAEATKSELKEQAIRLIIESSDTEEEEEKTNGIQTQAVEINDLSLRQLKKKFREQLQLGKKKMDNNNTKVVGGGEGKVRTALQPLSDNTMTMDGLDKKF